LYSGTYLPWSLADGAYRRYSLQYNPIVNSELLRACFPFHAGKEFSAETKVSYQSIGIKALEGFGKLIESQEFSSRLGQATVRFLLGLLNTRQSYSLGIVLGIDCRISQLDQ